MKQKTKKLNTLVEDIYSKLSVLGEGKSLDLSDEVIDKFDVIGPHLLNEQPVRYVCQT